MTKRMALSALLVALAFVFGYIEFLIPLPFGIPGMKLGLANLVVLVALYVCGAPTAATVSLVRIVLGGFTFGSPFGMLYSLAGGILSFAGMALTYRSKHFSTVGVSILGGVLHNIGQLAVAFIVLGVAGVIYYLPLLLFSGALCGALIGVLTATVRRAIQKTGRGMQ